MAVGLSITTANTMLDTIVDPYIQMHIGDPGADGTSNIAAMTDRVLADLAPAFEGARTLAAPLEWPSTWPDDADQTVSYVTGWSAPTGGTFIFSSALASQIDFIGGMVARVSVMSVSIPNLAAD